MVTANKLGKVKVRVRKQKHMVKEPFIKIFDWAIKAHSLFWFTATVFGCCRQPFSVKTLLKIHCTLTAQQTDVVSL